MVNKETGFILSDKSPAAGDDSESLRHLTKPEFARRLHKLMVAKGWNQSQLGQAARLSRNNISSYMNEKSYPSRLSLDRLSIALGLKPETLLPNITSAALRSEKTPEMSLATSSADPDVSWLIINTRVSTRAGIEILARIKEDRVSEMNATAINNSGQATVSSAKRKWRK